MSKADFSKSPWFQADFMIAALIMKTDSHCQENLDLCTPRKETARPQSQFPHSCFCEQFIYFHDRSTYFPAAE
jgi:hypothetical protein